MTQYEISAQYIAAKYGNFSADHLKSLMKAAANEIENIKRKKSDVFARYPRTHGRFQQSQLDVLDIQEQKMCAVFDNVSDMISA